MIRVETLTQRTTSYEHVEGGTWPSTSYDPMPSNIRSMKISRDYAIAETREINHPQHYYNNV